MFSTHTTTIRSQFVNALAEAASQSPCSFPDVALVAVVAAVVAVVVAVAVDSNNSNSNSNNNSNRKTNAFNTARLKPF